MSYSFESAERAFKDGQIRDLSHHAQGMRFLKLRSLSRKEHLNRLIADHYLQIPEGRPAARLKDLFESDITDAQIDATIRVRVLHEILPVRNHFDAIWACGSCVHMAREALERQLYEFLAVLKPNGILGLSLQVETPSVIQDDGRFFERYEQQEINTKVESIGYNIVNVNYDINNKSTTADKTKIKKWYNIVAISPSSKGKVLQIQR